MALDGGGEAVSTDEARGRVAVSVHPWDVALAPLDSEQRPGSAQNRLPAAVTSITAIGNRVRVGLEAGQPLTAEVTAAAVAELSLERGSRVAASWKAAATRLVAL